MATVSNRLWRLVAAMASAVLLAAAGPPDAATPASPHERRIALVIGNSAYRNTAPLANPMHDARDMGAALERTGFEVVLAVDATKADMDAALRAFTDKLAGADVALFYYAGHGLQVGSQNFLVPVEAKLARERDLEFEAVRLDFVLRQMEIDRDGKTTIVMLDACRDNPLTRSLARSMGTRSAAVAQGLAPASTGVGTFIAYSTQPGNVALDGAGRNSPFTAALLANIDASGRNLNATMIEVRKAVITATDGRQVPWDHSALTGDFFFVPVVAQSGSTSAAPAGRRDDVEALKARLKSLEDEAQRRRQDAAAGASVAPTADIVRLAEARARLAVAEDKAKDLMQRLLEARRLEGQATDAAERQRRVQASIRIQMDMTQASLLAQRLKQEIAALATPPKPAAAATTALDLRPVRAEGGFDIYEGAGLAGDKIKFGAADSVAGCLAVCGNTPGCMAGEWSPSSPREAQCSVYRHVLRVAPGAAGTAVFVKSGKGAADAAAAFEILDDQRIDGAVTRSFRAPSPDACREACQGDAGCVAYQHGRKLPMMGECQLFSGIAGRERNPSWRAGVRR